MLIFVHITVVGSLHMVNSLRTLFINRKFA